MGKKYIKNKLKNINKKVFSYKNEKIPKVISKIEFPFIFSFLSQEELLKYINNITEKSTTVYDKALDAKYLRDHIGGGNHRMFDGGHDIINAWNKIKEVKDNDKFIVEVAEYFNSLYKDLITTKGLPFKTWNKNNYEEVAKWIDNNIAGANRSWTYDLMSYDVFEVFSTVLGVTGIIFSFKKNDMKKLAEILGSTGIISLLSANLLLGILTIIIASYAYFIKKKEFKAKEFNNGIVLSTTSMAIFALLGISVFFEFILVIVVYIILKEQLNKEIKVRNLIENFYKKNIKNRDFSFIDNMKRLPDWLKNLVLSRIYSQ